MSRGAVESAIMGSLATIENAKYSPLPMVITGRGPQTITKPGTGENSAPVHRRSMYRTMSSISSFPDRQGQLSGHLSVSGMDAESGGEPMTAEARLVAACT